MTVGSVQHPAAVGKRPQLLWQNVSSLDTTSPRVFISHSLYGVRVPEMVSRLISNSGLSAHGEGKEGV